MFRRPRRKRIHPLEYYRKIKTSQQFWKKNENPFFKEFNKKKEDEKSWIEEAEKYKIQGKNTFKELVEGDKLNYSDIEYIKSKKIFADVTYYYYLRRQITDVIQNSWN